MKSLKNKICSFVKINLKYMAETTNDPGFGYNSKQGAQHIINKDGTTNIIHLNRKSNVNDLYSYLISISWTRFFFFVFFGYVLINVGFGIIYTSIGIDQITPSTGNLFKDFLNGFFFSAQTITTVGYGGITPVGMTANIVSTFEALIGLLSFSFITGLLYGRFSKPRASLKFSDNIILRDFKENRALMFRLMNNRKNIMIEPEVSVTLSISNKDDQGEYKREFYNLDLERKNIMYLPTIWTIVHEIDNESPLYQYTDDKIYKLDAEIYILIQYHEESFSQKVYQMFSYNFKDLRVGHQFIPSFSINQDGYVVLDHNLLNSTEPMLSTNDQT